MRYHVGKISLSVLFPFLVIQDYPYVEDGDPAAANDDDDDVNGNELGEKDTLR